MCQQVSAGKSQWYKVWSSGRSGVLVLLLSYLPYTFSSVCPPPPEPENGGFMCHPPHCEKPFTSGSVIEYFCAEGYMLKGDYKFLTCKNGAWSPPMGVSCRLSQDTNRNTSLGVPTLSIVASTASSVALILLLIVLFVLLQPKIKSFHHSRRETHVPGEQVSIMVDGVQVALPSYEEAVYGSAGNCIPSASSRVQIVLSEGPGEEQDIQQELPDSSIPGQSVQNTHTTGPAMAHNSQCTAGSSQQSETVLVHQTSQWVSGAHSRTLGREGADSESSDVQSLLSLSSEEYTDDIPLLKEA
ncbi:PREDICTED: sushi domain-containing protein 6 [Nanorana parkeri]|uniref:sushi domain-containing protein 6 n=1 Tax=Nanorana parkeri TaxID=125878 RepID=UPI000854CE21|nr:PREDICTED: sushi domain-containing protein 6 [Nanorana parkeri]